MNLLFNRSQTSGSFGKVKFNLWGKLELTKAEQDLVQRYRFDQSTLIAMIQPGLLRRSIVVGVILFSIFAAFGLYLGTVGAALGGLVGIFCAFMYFHNNRETIYVKDLLHGRFFKCETVVDLAHKEAFLERACAYLRQVMESATHWDGEEKVKINPLPKAEAKEFML